MCWIRYHPLIVNPLYVVLIGGGLFLTPFGTLSTKLIIIQGYKKRDFALMLRVYDLDDADISRPCVFIPQQPSILAPLSPELVCFRCVIIARGLCLCIIILLLMNIHERLCLGLHVKVLVVEAAPITNAETNVSTNHIPAYWGIRRTLAHVTAMKLGKQDGSFPEDISLSAKFWWFWMSLEGTKQW